jgi:hypothetical protein
LSYSEMPSKNSIKILPKVTHNKHLIKWVLLRGIIEKQEKEKKS